ncbi:MAG: glycosyltransferase [Candidatus Margulisiibacteriota bacterium]
MKNKILFFQFSFLPGYKAGGSLRTLANLVDHLGAEFDLRIVCTDRDSGDDQPYPGIKIGEWQTVGPSQVMYLSPQNRTLKDFRQIILVTKPDLVYLNSFFHPVFSRQPLILRRLGSIPKIPFIIAPRGEFSAGAIGLKSLKKHLYIYLARLWGLVDGVAWHASNEQEAADIRALFGAQSKVLIALDLPTKSLVLKSSQRQKKPGSLKIVFLARIDRKKNLSGALEMLNGLRGEVRFNIYGPIGDNGYWQDCQKIIKSLPANIEAHYCGEIEHNKVIDVLKEHDLFFVPTLGENFGYVYLEALSAGCPILLSDQTPWQNLEEKGVGWALPLSQKRIFQEVLQQCVDMGKEEHALWSKRANLYGLAFMQDKGALEKNRSMFDRVLLGMTK